MRVTSLIENSKLETEAGLVAEHGLSLHVQLGHLQILFDTGATGAFVDNARTLGIDLAEVDVAVLSHHHYDHGGGLARFLQLNETARVWLRAGQLTARYFRAMGVIRKPIGLDLEVLDQYADRLEYVSADVEVAPGVALLTRIGTRHPRPAGNRHLLVKRSGSLVSDPFDHELIMVLREPDGIVVFSGCSHSGILNMIEAAVERFPGEPIKAVFGGFHLIGNPVLGTMAHERSEVEALGRSILEMAPGTVFTGHCTGRKAFEVLREVMGPTLQPFPTGAAVEV